MSLVMVSHAGIVTLFSVTCTPFVLMLSGRLRTSGTPGREVSLYFGVSLELMLNAVAVSSEETYLGHSTA